MFKSMTGYGKAVCELPQKNIVIEIRTLNSKNLDISFRIPSAYKEKEQQLRNEISQMLERGKIEVSFNTDGKSEHIRNRINPQVVTAYFEQIKSLPKELTGNENNLLPAILRLPDSIDFGRDEPDESEWTQLEQQFREALQQVDTFRLQEGNVLEKDILSRIRLIDSLIQEIEAFEPERIAKLKKRFHDNIEEWTQGVNFDNNRLEQEIFFYLEKLDITEEKVRLHQHCLFFLETAALPESQGKKLGFIAQEIGREINTLGSKSNHSSMQRVVVAMKDELEKIKEQLLNVV